MLACITEENNGFPYVLIHSHHAVGHIQLSSVTISYSLFSIPHLVPFLFASFVFLIQIVQLREMHLPFPVRLISCNMTNYSSPHFPVNDIISFVFTAV